jgi:hypothetical protein
MRIYITALSALLLAGCSKPTVSARTFYTSRNDLAAYVIGTPDPQIATKGLGQSIWVRWTAPELCEKTHLDVTIRFNDASERHETYPVANKFGWIMVEIKDTEYKKKKGLASYSISLRKGEIILASTQHKMWTDKIQIEDL